MTHCNNKTTFEKIFPMNYMEYKSLPGLIGFYCDYILISFSLCKLSEKLSVVLLLIHIVYKTIIYNNYNIIMKQNNNIGQVSQYSTIDTSQQGIVLALSR